MRFHGLGPSRIALKAPGRSPSYDDGCCGDRLRASPHILAMKDSSTAARRSPATLAITAGTI
jgi:hypothetical protein